MDACILTVIGLARALEMAVRENGLTSSGFRALSLIDTGITSSGLIARFLDVKPSTVTTVMDGLFAEDLVERIRSENDRRRVDYELTALGQTVLAKANDKAADALQTLATGLTAAEGRDAFRGLDLWSSAIEARRSTHWGAQ